MIEQGREKLLPTKAELWSACRQGVRFDENDLYPNPFSKCAAGLVWGYRQSVRIWEENDHIPLDWPHDQLVPDRLTIAGPHAQVYGLAIAVILGYQLTIDIDAEEALPRPRPDAEPFKEPLSAVISRFACHYALTQSEFGYPKHGFDSDQGALIAAERTYVALANALDAGDVYLPPPRRPSVE